MTLKSLECFKKFLIQYVKELKPIVADYGGTNKIGDGLVKGILYDVKRSLSYHYEMLDYDNGVDLLKPIKKKYGLGICMDLLEHTENPFIVAENISNSLKKGALLFVTAPFIWEQHDFPKDYWRFTPQGLVTLFSKLKMIGAYCIRDQGNGEAVPRMRSVAVFRK